MLWLLLACPSPSTSSMRTKPIAYTKHGRCRMACRKVDEDEVRRVLESGRLDPARTRRDGECPSHALEGQGDGGERLRIVFADCPTEVRVVTVIDLDTDWPCGDC